jgi:hypothetical protein
MSDWRGIPEEKPKKEKPAPAVKPIELYPGLLVSRMDIWRALVQLKNTGASRDEIFAKMRLQVVPGIPDDQLMRDVDEVLAPPKPPEPPRPLVEILRPADDPVDDVDFDDATELGDAGEDEPEPEPAPRYERGRREPEDADGEERGGLDLLPIAGMPGYLVDIYGVPHAVKSRGRRGGPIRPDRFWRRDRTFITGFRVRVDGRRARYTPRYFQMARFFAEQKRDNAEMVTR